MFGWLEKRRQREILSHPFPDEWRAVLMRRMRHFGYLDDDERAKLEQLVQIFVAEKTWTGCGGFELTEDVEVTIAGQACLLVLCLDHVLYKNVNEILVYPSTVVTRSDEVAAVAGGMAIATGPVPILGEALDGGPVLLVWDDVAEGAVHPERGHNVVYHEFAHKLDMLDGSINGMPPMHSPAQYREWVDVCTEEYQDLKARIAVGRHTFLDPYASTNVGEFFAVATEYFFDEPVAMERNHPRLYSVLQGYYNQDPADREHRVRGAPDLC